MAKFTVGVGFASLLTGMHLRPPPMAERVRFELTNHLRGYLFSRQAG